MNKVDLIETLREKAKLTKIEAKNVVNLFFDEMSNALANGDRVEIRGSMLILRQALQTIYRKESENRRTNPS